MKSWIRLRGGGKGARSVDGARTSNYDGLLEEVDAACLICLFCFIHTVFTLIRV